MIKLSAKKISIASVSAFFALIPATPVLALTSSTHDVQQLTSRPLFLLKGHGNSSTSAALTQSASENWSGYVGTGANSAFTSVSSTWEQPTLSCVSKTASYSAFWVGLDGYSDQTVEQIGTEANCSQGKAQYSTWYEMYPQNPTELQTKLNVEPGDQVSATVSYTPPTPTKSRNIFRNSNNNGTFTLTLTDLTTKSTYTTSQSTNRAANRSSAEVIAEAPYSNGILPLANFGTVNFTSSEVNGSPIGSASGLQDVTMEDPHGMVATPSALDLSGEDFSIVWSD